MLMVRWVLPLALLLSTAAAAADSPAIPNRLEKARAGEWVAYAAMGGITEKQTIIEVEEKDGDRLFTVGRDLIVGDEIVQSDETIVSLNDSIKENESLLAAGESVAVTRDREPLLGGEMIDVAVIETVEEGETYRTVISDSVPVFGIVRIEANGIPIMEVADFGE